MYYLKTCGHNIVTQVVVDYNKMFMDVFVGLFGSMNDSRVLQRSSLYKHVQYKILLDVGKGINNGPFLPYLIGAKDPNIHSFHGS